MLRVVRKVGGDTGSSLYPGQARQIGFGCLPGQRQTSAINGGLAEFTPNGHDFEIHSGAESKRKSGVTGDE